MRVAGSTETGPCPPGPAGVLCGTPGYPSDATESAIQASIVATGYR